MIKTEEELDNKYKKYSYEEGNEPILDHKHALDYLEDARVNNFIILGVDFYDIRKDGVYPMLNSIDNSSIASDQDAVQKSYDFTKNIIHKEFPDKATHASFVVKKK